MYSNCIKLVLQMFSVKLNDDVKASSFKENQKVYIDPMKLLPLDRFLQPASGQRGRGGGRGGDSRGGRGGRGGFDRGFKYFFVLRSIHVS